MATRQQRQREEIWASHILNWKKSSGQIRAYCREKGISHKEKTLPISPFKFCKNKSQFLSLENSGEWELPNNANKQYQFPIF